MLIQALLESLIEAVFWQLVFGKCRLTKTSALGGVLAAVFHALLFYPKTDHAIQKAAQTKE